MVLAGAAEPAADVLFTTAATIAATDVLFHQLWHCTSTTSI